MQRNNTYFFQHSCTDVCKYKMAGSCVQIMQIRPSIYLWRHTIPLLRTLEGA